MQSFIEQLSVFSSSILRSTLQVSILICLILLTKSLLRHKLRARWHYCLWLLLLVRILIPWAPQSNMSVFNLVPEITTNPTANPIETVTPTKTTPASPALPVTEQPTSTTANPIQQTFEQLKAVTIQSSNILAILWLTGAIALAGYILAENFKLWRIVKHQRPVTQQWVLDLLEDCKTQMGISTILGVVVTDRVKSPALFGFIRPRLLLPTGLIETLTPQQLSHILSHELAHLKRHDIGLNWLAALAQTLHWFNPLVWYAFYKMRIDRELACDALALVYSKTEEHHEYGRTIVELLEKFAQPRRLPSLAGIIEDKSQLKRRITMITKFKKNSYKWSISAAILLAVLSCVALTNAQSSSQDKQIDKKSLAKEFVQLLVNEDFKAATKTFDATMKKALPAERLKEVWKSTTGQAGAFQKQLGVRKQKWLWSDIIFVTCQFEKGPLDVKVVYDKKTQISGLWFVPVDEDILQSYENQNQFRKIDNNRGDKKYDEQKVKSKDAEFFFEKIGNPEPGYHRFSGMWALIDKGRKSDKQTTKDIVKRASKIIKDRSETSLRRWHCCYVISGIGAEEGIDVLAEALFKDNDLIVRGVAACALGAFTNDQAITALEQAKQKEYDKRVLGWIDKALSGEFRKGHDIAIEAQELIRRVENPFEQLQTAYDQQKWQVVNVLAERLQDIFGDYEDNPKFGKKAGDLSELADELHDTIRDNEMNLVPAHYEILNNEWQHFKDSLKNKQPDSVITTTKASKEMLELMERAENPFKQLQKAYDAQRWPVVNVLAERLQDIFSDYRNNPKFGKRAWDLSELADDLHDAIRDGEMELVPAHYEVLNNEWEHFKDTINKKKSKIKRKTRKKTATKKSKSKKIYEDKWQQWEQQFDQWGEKFENQMTHWGQQFGSQWDNWGQQMEQWGQQMQQWGQQMEQWEKDKPNEPMPVMPIMPVIPVMPSGPSPANVPPMPPMPPLDKLNNQITRLEEVKILEERTKVNGKEIEAVKEFTAEMSPGATLNLKNVNGAIKIIGSQANQAKIIATIKVKAKTEKKAWQLKSKTKILVMNTDKGLTVETELPKLKRKESINIAFEITVPKQTNLKLDNKNGALEITNIEGLMLAHVSNGAITAKNIAGKVQLHTNNGRIKISNADFQQCKASTNNGQITCRQIAGDIDLKTNNGKINVNYAKDAAPVINARVKTDIGEIDFRGPANISATVEIESAIGSIDVPKPLKVNKTMTGGKVSGTIGDGQGKITLKTSMGSITLK
ncbi:M56 family metallopeptidase [Planctomycetota bacterium]